MTCINPAIGFFYLSNRRSGGRLRGYRPSSDTPTHLYLYQEFPRIESIVHTHSTYATCWAQAGEALPCYGTTPADYFHGSIPVTQPLDAREIERDYEWNTGKAIVKRFRELGIDPSESPAVLVRGHGPFTWGDDLDAAIENSIPEKLNKRLNFSWSNWGFGLEPLEDSVDRLVKHGVRYIKPHGNLDGPDLGYRSVEVNRILEARSVKCSGICGMFSPENELASNSGRGRQN